MTTKERIGVVVSNKMQKTVVVAVENRAPSRKYGKTVVTTKRYKVHDENNDCNEGDRVRIRETRPLSKQKRWEVASIIESASGQKAPEPISSETEQS
ncbi:30S ribosomal protein S17 [Euhalothece natronophila Z-M001]|uniref:Small ribosomal subunit protein uS17 n=1 Tax=Euhalothece natronophila Z-M001 TaxID=522448 RepID=A0A5B8NPP3_9CHRO|nr:30S ribosomal protein S17 [Euhalothece natronophila]QDZ40115.1 30S ribosomal protein S17 [Euhalothece natronophila Z-M001]